MLGKFSSQPAKCPFCDTDLKRPAEVEPRRLGDFSYGQCPCGAVYVCDETGHNLGAALVEALGYACKDDWDLAWALMPEEDYHDEMIEHYDLQTHRVYPSGRTNDGRTARAVLVFIRLSRDLQEAQVYKSEHKASANTKQPPTTNAVTAKKYNKPKKRFNKKEIEALVKLGESDKLAIMAQYDSLVLRKIQRLLYSADDNIKWNAVMCLGKAAGSLVKSRPEVVGDLVRRLLYASNDSAAASWGALEAVGEIIRWTPDVFGSFVRHLLAMLRDPPSRPAVLWAAGRIGTVHPELIKSSAFFAIFDCLNDPDPQTRGHAVWALGQIKAKEAQNSINKLLNDEETLDIFDGELRSEVTIGDLAKEALKLIDDKDPVLSSDNNISSKSEDSTMTQEKNTNNEQSDNQQKELSADEIYKEADILKTKGMSMDAIEKYRQALALFEREGRDVEIANCCEKLADLHIMRGDFKGAIPIYQRAMAICEKKNDPISMLLLLEKVIDIYRHLDDTEKLLTYLFHALELCEKLGDATRAGMYLTGVGDIYQRQNRLDDALDAYRLALKLYQGMKSRERVEILQKGIKSLEEQLANTTDTQK